jgi:hypothetical protein
MYALFLIYISVHLGTLYIIEHAFVRTRSRYSGAFHERVYIYIYIYIFYPYLPTYMYIFICTRVASEHMLHAHCMANLPVFLQLAT